MAHIGSSLRWWRELLSRLVKPWPDPVLPFDPDGPGLRVYALGTSGSAPARQLRQTTSYLVEHHGFRILVDAGTGLLMNYPPNRNPMADIDAIVLSHLHPDHTGDLEQFAVSFVYGLPGGVARPDIPAHRRYPKKTIYGPRGTFEYLKARLNAYESEAELVPDERLREAFDFVEWDFPQPGGSLTDARRYRYELRSGLTLTAIPVNHVLTDHVVPAYGFRFEVSQGGRRPPLVVGYSGDTMWHPNLVEIARDADLLICDVAGPPVHLTASEAGSLAAAANVKVLGGTHVMPWIELPPVMYRREAQQAFEGHVTMLMSGMCYLVDGDVGASRAISLATGQPVSEYEQFLFLHGMDPAMGQYRPRGIELRTPPGVPNEPEARRRRLSSRRFLLATVVTPRFMRRAMERLAAAACGREATDETQAPLPAGRGRMATVAEIHRLSEADWELLRAVRLAALQEAPYAFGSTYKREAAFGERDWRSRLTTSAWFAALADGRSVGIVTGMHRDELQYRRELLSMWVDPAWRGSDVGTRLVGAVQEWARAAGAAVLTLSVADGNERARRFYEKLGFTMTGVSKPLASDPSVETVEFGRQL